MTHTFNANNITWVLPSVTGNGFITIVTSPTNSDPLPNLSLDFSEKKTYPNGCICKKCNELYPFAEPNQIDETLICYSCRLIW